MYDGNEGNNGQNRNYGNSNGQYQKGNYQNNNGGGGYSNGNRGGGGNYGGNRGGYGGNRGGYGGGGNYGGNRGGYNRNQEDDNPTGEVKIYRPYVISGNPNASEDMLTKLAGIAKELEDKGYMLRSGGLDGIEDAVEKATNVHEIHLPWNGFADKQSKFSFTSNEAKTIAGQFHPAYDGLKPVIQTFLAKNVRMVMGKDLRGPALFAIIWSEDGAESMKEKTSATGNVGHLLAVACSLRIPIFNFGKSDAEARLRKYLELEAPHHHVETTIKEESIPF